MLGSPQTANLPAGTMAPVIGIYVVAHRNPAHALPHDVLISSGMILPHCSICFDVRFSLRGLDTPPIEECEFFRHAARHLSEA
jgi:hypothetical protein